MKKSVVLAIAGGLSLFLAAPPLNLWPFAFIGLCFLYLAIDIPSPKSRFLVSWLGFVAMFICTLAWTMQFSGVGWPILSLFQGLIFAVFLTFLPSSPSIGRYGWQRVIGFPSALFIAEFLRERWPLGGFPMGTFTTGQTHGPLFDSASIFGEPGFIFLVALCAAGATEAFRLRSTISFIALACIAAMLGSTTLIGSRTSTYEVDELTVALVQGGGIQAIPKDKQNPGKVFADHYSQTEQVPSGTDLIVWPEDVIDIDTPISESNYGQIMSDLAKSHNATVVAGVVESLPDGKRFRNYAMTWNRDGSTADSYEKVKRVPFGEYLPLRGVLGNFIDESLLPTDATVGKGRPVIKAEDRVAGVSISYEALFASRTRDAVRSGAEFLLIPTNAASYKSPNVAKTQIEAARLRAVETRRWVLQSAPTGISAIIDPNGNVQQRTEVGTGATLTSQIAALRGQTPYSRWGDIPLFVISLTIGIFVLGRETASAVKNRVEVRLAVNKKDLVENDELSKPQNSESQN